jgi:hypothetical protein
MTIDLVCDLDVGWTASARVAWDGRAHGASDRDPRQLPGASAIDLAGHFMPITLSPLAKRALALLLTAVMLDIVQRTR